MFGRKKQKKPRNVTVKVVNGRPDPRALRKLTAGGRRDFEKKFRKFAIDKRRRGLDAAARQIGSTDYRDEVDATTGLVTRRFLDKEADPRKASAFKVDGLGREAFVMNASDPIPLRTGAAIAGQINACSVPDHPFATCASNPQDLCCRTSDSMTAIGEAETAGGACIGLPDCGATSSILSLAGGALQCNAPSGPIIFDGPHYIGNWPFTGFIPTAERLAVWCDNGTVNIAALDADNCDVTPSHSVTWDPNTLTGTVTFPGQVGTCCFENEATTEMRIQLKLD